MPYNNTPIPPSQAVSGQVSLPLARVQKIIAADIHHPHVSKNASFAIALATEMFIQHLATTTHNVVKAERKPRRNIQYRDVSSAVSKTDNLEFLVDVVPKTTTYKEYKKKREEAGKGKEPGIQMVVNGKGKGKAAEGTAVNGVENGTTANGNGVKGDEVMENGHVEDKGDETEDAEEEVEETPAAEPMEVDGDETLSAKEDEDEEDPAARQIEMEMRGPRANGSTPVTRRTSGFTAINGSR